MGDIRDKRKRLEESWAEYYRRQTPRLTSRLDGSEDQPRDELGRFGSGGGGGKKPAGVRRKISPAQEAQLQETFARQREYDDRKASFRARLDPHEVASVETYGGPKYHSINSLARHGTVGPYHDKSDIEAHVKNLDSALAKMEPTDKDSVVFRGAYAPKVFADVKPGDVIHDKGFVSTSTDDYVAHRFAASDHTVQVEENGELHNRREPGTLMHIHVPKGYKLSPMPTTYSEHELTFPRNTSFKIMSVSKDDEGRQVIHMEAQ